MVGFVIVSHGKLGKALVESANLILGTQNDIHTISVSYLSQNAVTIRKDIINAIDAADDGDGVVVFTDLFGGTPCNLASSLLSLKKIEVVAGVNMPMILRVLTLEPQKQYTLREVAELAKEAGQKQISIVSA
ncbi:MAG: PTS sugar transporter subunit IIA [Holosporales bacterium]|jgi:PTS system mannose-specific IIA component|nr:PTS sugar transporter subunit IIA [Holosporales bacterium]